MTPLTDGALVHVLVAGSPGEARGAGADGTAVKGVGVAHRALVAGVTDAGVLQVAEQTCRQTDRQTEREMKQKCDTEQTITVQQSL